MDEYMNYIFLKNNYLINNILLIIYLNKNTKIFYWYSFIFMKEF